MKKVILLVSLFFTTLSLTYAQKAILKVEKVGESVVPGAVMSSIEDQFDDAYIESISIIPTELISDDYEISYKKPITSFASKNYEVELVSNNFHGKIYINDKGEVILTKEQITDGKLPKKVNQYIKDNYPGWVIIKTYQTIKSNQDKGKSVYCINITKGKKQKAVYFSESENYLKDSTN